ncbi:SCO2400 family protein [Streptomyces sp. NPDC054797]
MNYCHACRRHLNGALACAGCGTPAEYLMPAAPGSVPAPAAPVVDEPPTALADVFADSLVVLSAPNERRAGARRRATQRKRRRTVLTFGLGLLVVCGGALAAVHLVTDVQRTDRAAKVVLTDEGPQQPAPLPDLPHSGAPTGAGSGKATKAAAGGTKKSGAGAPSGSAAQPGPMTSPPAPSTSGPVSGTPAPGTSVQASGSGTPSPGASGSAQPPPPPSPSPTPKPTKSCVLWIFCS